MLPRCGMSAGKVIELAVTPLEIPPPVSAGCSPPDDPLSAACRLVEIPSAGAVSPLTIYEYPSADVPASATGSLFVRRSKPPPTSPCKRENTPAPSPVCAREGKARTAPPLQEVEVGSSRSEGQALQLPLHFVGQSRIRLLNTSPRDGSACRRSVAGRR